ncbi:MAG TPA: hypothetical protein VM425_08285 [Myxococcota bacterium]|nr:hypothetical protein [Myxococcota bacterium]
MRNGVSYGEYRKKLVFDDMRHWDEDGGSNVEVYLYDFDSSKEKRITYQPRQQFYPKISGYQIVWEDYQKGNFYEDIVLYNQATGEQKNLTNDVIRQFAPDIYGDLIVWTDLRNGEVFPNGTYQNADIYSYRISNGELTRITNEEHDQEYPVIHGKWIAWTDIRFGTRDSKFIPDTTNVFAYNTETHEEKQVTFGKGFHEGMPKIWGDKMVFYSFKTGGWGALWLVDLKTYWPDDK